MVASFAPVVGPFFNELIEEVIPNQRQERVAKYLTRLGGRLQVMEVRLEDLAKTRTPEQVALFEEGARASTRSTSEKAIERIARVVAEGIDAEAFTVDQQRRLVEVLESLSDSDVVILVALSQGAPPTIPLLTPEELAAIDDTTAEGRMELFRLRNARQAERLPILQHQLRRMERMALIEQPTEIGLQPSRSFTNDRTPSLKITNKPIRLMPLGKLVLAKAVQPTLGLILQAGETRAPPAWR